MENIDFFNAPDTLLWSCFREGNSRAYELIYERHIHALTNYGLRITFDRELVKDAVHDLFVDLWKHKEHLSQTGSVRFYLFKALRHLLIKKINRDRKLQWESVENIEEASIIEFSQELTIVHAEIAEDQLKRLNKEMDALPARQKEALYLRYHAGFDYAEIATILHVNKQSAYNLIFRAIQVLREKMVKSTIFSLLSIFFL
jgi:RNA polymerase sigma factor (sigma-70 family)